MKKLGLLLALCLGLILSLMFVSISVSAAEEDLIFYDFSSKADEWLPGDNVKEAVVDLYSFPGSATVRSCLKIGGYSVFASMVRSTAVEFPSPLDLTEYHSFAYDIFAPEYEADPMANYYTRIVLHSSDGSSIDNIIEIDSGKWQQAKIEVGGWKGRSSITSAEISFIVTSSESGFNENDFYIDNVMATDKIDRELTYRFLFDVPNVEGGKASFSPDKNRLNIALSPDAATTLSCITYPVLPDWETDTLRLRIKNSSDIDYITVNYVVSDDGLHDEEKSVSLKVERQSDFTGYNLDVGDISKLRSLRFEFPAQSGSVSIASISAAPEYRPEKLNFRGSLSDCRLTDDLLSIRFTGDVTRDAALSNQDGTIEIFAIEPCDLFSEIDYSKLTPVIASPMTTKFDLSLPLEGAIPNIKQKQFVAFITLTDGTRELLAAPFFLENAELAAKVSIKSELKYKGAVASDISILNDLRADLTVLELDVRDAFTSFNSARHFIFGESTFYFENKIFDELHRKTSALSTAGIDVLLRITGWSDSVANELAYSYLNDSYIEDSSASTILKGESFLAALTSYIAESFCIDGSIDGIIFGDCVNVIGERGLYDNLQDIAEFTAGSLRVIKSNLAETNSQTKLYLSISNLLSSDVQSRTDELGADIFLSALCGEITRGGNFDWGICIDEIERSSDSLDDLIVSSNTSKLISIIRTAGVYDTRLIFCDRTFSDPTLNLDDMLTKLMLNFYAANFDSHIDSAISIIPQRENTVEIIKALTDLDSNPDAAEAISKIALSKLQADNWKAVIESFDAGNLVWKNTTYAKATETIPEDSKGRFGYYTFDSFTEADTFKGSFYCTGLNIETGSNIRLRASLSSSSYGGRSAASSMGIAHRYEISENYKYTPMLELTLGLDNVAPSSVSVATVSIILTSGADRLISDVALKVGEVKTVYLDIGSFSGITAIDGIQIMLNSTDINTAELLLGKIDGLSFENNDEALAELVTKYRVNKPSPTEDNKNRNLIWFIGAAFVGVLTIITVGLLSRRRDADDE